MSDITWTILSNDDKTPPPLKLKPKEEPITPPKLEFLDIKITHKHQSLKKSPFTKELHSNKIA